MLSTMRSWACIFSPVCFVSLLLTLSALVMTTAPLQADWDYISNGSFVLGVDLSRGAGIGHFSDNASSGNVLNHYDNGRYIQQSYYGDADGSYWNGTPWVYNPVQGGGANLNSTLLDYSNDGSTIYARVMPRHWATGALLPEATMEEWIDLTDDYAHIKFRMTYTGATTTDGPRHQEMPAVFVRQEMSELHFYDGGTPWTGGATTVKTPGWPNEYNNMTEEWFAYTYANDWGVGVYTPGTDFMTNYVFNGDPGPTGSGCAYAAPIRTFALISGNAYEYDVYLTLGSVTEIRDTFAAINGNPPTRTTTGWEFNTLGNREGWTPNAGVTHQGVSEGTWEVSMSGADPFLVGPVVADPAENALVVEIAMSSTDSNTLGQLFWQGADDTYFSEDRSRKFTVLNDGEIHHYQFDLTGDFDVDGALRQLRLDPAAGGNGGLVTIDYIRVLTFAVAGDFNGDGAVDVADLGILSTNYGAASGMGVEDGDTNGDGAVDVIDLGILATNYGMTSSSAAVPEPGISVLLAGMLLAAGLRRGSGQ